MTRPRPERLPSEAKASSVGQWRAGMARVGEWIDAHFGLSCLLVAVPLHIWAAWVFGAVFGADSVVYSALGESLFSRAGLASFYTPANELLYSHISAGLPLLWRFCLWAPLGAPWLWLATAQHGLSIWATVCAAQTARLLAPGRWPLLILAIASIHPYFQWAHNALLSESGAFSLLLLGLCHVLRIAKLGPSWKRLLATGACIVAATQFRSPSGGMLLAAFLPVALFSRWTWRQRTKAFGVLLAAMIVGAVVFPLYRLAMIGQFFLAHPGSNWLVSATFINPHPSAAASAQLRELGWPTSFPTDRIPAQGFTYHEARQLGLYLVAHGLTPYEAAVRINDMSRVIIADKPGAWKLRLRSALEACGWAQLAYAGADDGVVYWNKTLSGLRLHYASFVHWISWVDQADHRSLGVMHFLRGNMMAPSPAAGLAVWPRLEPYVSQLPPARRDPLGLLAVPLDCWAVLGFLSLLVCLWWNRAMGGALWAATGAHGWLYYLSILGNPRYSYPIFACYFLGACLAANVLAATTDKSHKRQKRHPPGSKRTIKVI